MVPAMILADGRRVSEQGRISAMIAAQLEPGEEKEKVEEAIEVEVTIEDLRLALKTSPTNRARGHDKIGNRFLIL